jgi:hypothetical protein
MDRMRPFLLAGALLVGAACGSDPPDIGGWYAVDTATQDSTACGAESPLAHAPPYLLVKKTVVDGKDYYAVSTCSTEDETHCVAGAGILDTPRKNDDGWHGTLAFVSGSPGCELGWVVYDAQYFPATLGLLLTAVTYADTDVDASMCTTGEAAHRGATMKCSTSTSYNATWDRHD